MITAVTTGKACLVYIAQNLLILVATPKNIQLLHLKAIIVEFGQDNHFAISSFDQRHIPFFKSPECRFNCAPETDGGRTLSAAAVSFIIHRGREDGTGLSSKFRDRSWLL